MDVQPFHASALSLEWSICPQRAARRGAIAHFVRVEVRAVEALRFNRVPLARAPAVGAQKYGQLATCLPLTPASIFSCSQGQNRLAERRFLAVGHDVLIFLVVVHRSLLFKNFCRPRIHYAGARESSKLVPPPRPASAAIASSKGLSLAPLFGAFLKTQATPPPPSASGTRLCGARATGSNAGYLCGSNHVLFAHRLAVLARLVQTLEPSAVRFRLCSREVAEVHRRRLRLGRRPRRVLIRASL